MDKKKKIELEVLNISNSQEQAGAYALVLGEVEGTRQLPVIIGAAEAQAMLISLKGIIPPRPLTHNLFASCLEVLGVNMMRALIYRVDNGVFYSYIYLKADDAIIRMDAPHIRCGCYGFTDESPHLYLRGDSGSGTTQNRKRERNQQCSSYGRKPFPT